MNEYSNEQLLFKLISQASNCADSPKTTTFVSPHKQFIFGIGNDWSVSLNIDVEALSELEQICGNRQVGSLNFSGALEALKNGEKVAREGWNGRGMWIAIQMPDNLSKMQLPYIYMSTAQKQLVPWLASQSDMLADDWMILE